MKSIVLIIPYFGKWPIWFEAFLKSVSYNETIHWLCPTDCEIPKSYPSNIRFVKENIAELNIKVNKVVEANVPLNPRKFCDLKPAYADIFSEYTQGYDFWGFCDMDIIWGDIRTFITNDILDKYDIISSRKEAISGHFTLFRNNQKVNKLYKKLPAYKSLFEHPKFKWTDEIVLTNYIKNDKEFKTSNLKVYWPEILLNQERGVDSRQEYYLDKWVWDIGRVIEKRTNNEVMYLHFINWKKFMKINEVRYDDSSKYFYISYTGIHFKKHPEFKKSINKVKNFFNGYYVKLKKRDVNMCYLKNKKRIKKNIFK